MRYSLVPSLVIGLQGLQLASAQEDPTITEGLNFASWSSHMADFPEETYCPQTEVNPLESEYEACRSSAFDVVWSCPNKEDSSSRTICICNSIVAMSSCLVTYCPANTVQASVISQDQDDYTSIYRCPSRLGAAGGGGGGSAPEPTNTGGPGSESGASATGRNSMVAMLFALTSVVVAGVVMG